MQAGASKPLALASRYKTRHSAVSGTGRHQQTTAVPASCLPPRSCLTGNTDQPRQTSIARLLQRLYTYGQHTSQQSSACCHAKLWRPALDDVDRLSRGQGAKRRGTGCHNIPHRLNAEERPLYEGAKKKGYLAVRGTGYRKNRKGNPLPNIYRQWCDAKAQPCIVIELDMYGDAPDVVVVDLAPLRLLDSAQAVARVQALAEQHSMYQLTDQDRPPDAVPFNTIPVEVPAPGANASSSSSSSLHSTDLEVQPITIQGEESAQPTRSLQSEVDACREAVEQQANSIRELKAGGASNQDVTVKEAVARLSALKDQLAHLEQQVARSKRMAAWSDCFAPSQPDSNTHSSQHDAMQTDNVQHTESKSASDVTVFEDAGGSSAFSHQSTSSFAGAQQRIRAANSASMPNMAVGSVSAPANHSMHDLVSGSNTEDSDGSQSSRPADTCATSSSGNDASSSSISASSSSSSTGSPATSSMATLSEDHPLCRVAIWQLPAQPLFFAAERSQAKAFAKAVAEEFVNGQAVAVSTHAATIEPVVAAFA